MASPPDSRDEEQGRELALLQRISMTVGASLDLPSVLRGCLDLAEELTSALACAIFIDEGDGDRLRLAAHRHAGASPPSPFDSLPRAVLDRLIAASGQPLVDEVDGMDEPYRSACRAAGLTRTLSFPLLAEGALVGLLSLGFPSKQEFSPSTMKTLLAMAEQQALAIDRARTHAIAELRARLSECVRKVAERALAAASPEEVFDALLDGLAGVAGGGAGRLSLFDDEGNFFTVRAHDMPAGLERVPPTSFDDPAVRWVRGLTGPFEARDVSDLPARSTVQRLFEEARLRSLLLLPLRSRGRMIGLLSSPSVEPRRFHPEQAQSFALLSSVASAAIESERLRREAERERRRLGQVLELLPVPVSVIDRQGRLEQVNAMVRVIAGRGAIGEPWESAIEGLRLARRDGAPITIEELPVTRALHSEEPPPMELRVQGPHGWRSMITHAVALRDEDGHLSGVVATAQDVTALRELADAKDRFLAMASHELRSPLGSLQAVTSQLQLDPNVLTDGARRRDLCSRILRQVDRLARLIGDIYDVERLRDGSLRLAIERVDLAEVAHEVVDLAESQAPGHRFRVEVEGPRPLDGKWDRVRIQQVLTNLVSNAIRYSPDGGEVLVTLRGDGAQVRAAVRDSGIGIPPAQRARLFEPGYRGPEAGKLVPAGLGLGLYISHEIVRRHGGRIEVDSEVGRGSCFTVLLPREPPARDKT